MTSFQNTDDIAIVGMSCRVAGANSPSELWELLETSRDVQKEIVRFNSEGYYKPTGGKRKGLTNVRHAYFLDGDIDRFDNGFFAIPATEALAMDPQQRLLLEIAYEAIESAGMPLDDFQGSDTAVYTGELEFDARTWWLQQYTQISGAKETKLLDLYSGPSQHGLVCVLPTNYECGCQS